MKLLFISLLLLAGGSTIFFLIILPNLSNTRPLLSPVETMGATNEPRSTQKISSTPLPTQATSILKPKLESILKDYSEIEVSLVYENLDTHEQIVIEATKPHTAASTTKLITAVYFLKQLEQGKQTWDGNLGVYPRKFQFEQLINRSNNDSWEYFLDLLGQDNEQEFARSLGLSTFKISDNTISAQDMSIFLNKLINYKIINQENTKYLLSLMHDTEDDSFIPDEFWKKYTIYHKNGKLEDAVNEAIIINAPSHNYTLSIYTDGNEAWEYDKRTELFHKLITATTI